MSSYQHNVNYPWDESGPDPKDISGSRISVFDSFPGRWFDALWNGSAWVREAGGEFVGQDAKPTYWRLHPGDPEASTIRQFRPDPLYIMDVTQRPWSLLDGTAGYDVVEAEQHLAVFCPITVDPPDYYVGDIPYKIRANGEPAEVPLGWTLNAADPEDASLLAALAC